MGLIGGATGGQGGKDMAAGRVRGSELFVAGWGRVPGTPSTFPSEIQLTGTTSTTTTIFVGVFFL